MSQKPSLTPEEYIEDAGCICPNCESEDIVTIGQVEVEEGVGHQAVKCSACGATWKDEYLLNGYVRLEYGP